MSCGGKVQVDDTDDGTSSTASGAGNAGSGAAGATGGTGAGASGGASSGCTSHETCGAGFVCIFATGECAPGCMGVAACEGCAPGSTCEGCATSSCPTCKDCTSACMPIQPGQCDTDDACPSGEQCFWGAGFCAPFCGPGGACPDGLACVSCATGSCCGCDDCVDLCLAVDG